jgi:hypothetical protein
VNFFGHAAVAYWFDRDPNFVLGAMLPDLAGMVHLRPPASRLPALTRGIALHHATDAAFHGIPTFVQLTRKARDDLLDRGLCRGPARALAHVGTEILLDESLGRDPEVETTYLRALKAADTAPLEWAKPEQARLLSELARSLYARGVPRSHPPELVARRLRRALELHPRLAFSVDDETRVAGWVVAFRPRVSTAADAIVQELRSRLESLASDSPTPERPDASSFSES